MMGFLRGNRRWVWAVALGTVLALAGCPWLFPDNPSYLISVTVYGQGTVSLDPLTGPYPEGSTVVVTATPAPGWFFAGWSGDLSGTVTPVALVMDGPKNITGTFTTDAP